MSGISVITGGSGHIGFALARELENNGCEYRLLVRSDRKNLDLLNGTRYRGDVCEVESLLHAFSGADTVYHCAGLIDISGEKDDLIQKVNVDGTRNVIEACRICGVKKLVCVSSVDAIVADNGDGELKEPESFEPERLEGAYARSKALSASMALEASEDMHVCVALPAACIGPYDYIGSEVSRTIELLKKFHFAFSLSFGRYDFVDVRDVASGLFAMAEHGVNGEAYILGGEVVTVDEFIRLLAQAAGEHPPVVRLSEKPLKAMLAAGERLFPEFCGALPLNSYALRKLKENCCFTCEKARVQLGYKPRSAAQAVAATVEWYAEQRSQPDAEQKH